MGIRERLLALKPNMTVQAVPLSNSVTVYVPRLSIGDMLELDQMKDDQSRMLALMVRDEQGNKILSDSEAGDMFLPADATTIISKCMEFNAVPEANGEGENPNP